MARTTRIDDVTLTGRSGARHTFRVYVWETTFKPVAGVYLVASRTVEPGQRPKYDPLFIGEAANLSTAVTDHPRDECFQMYYANVIGILTEGDPANRAAIVADLVEPLSPPCNAPDPI